MADDTKPFSEVVREYGQQQADHALHTADLWRSWAEQLDELIHDMPSFTRPWVHGEDGVPFQVEMGATNVVVPSAMRGRLHGVLANADAAAAALIRAAVVVENRSSDLANAFAIDEAEGMLAPADIEPAAEDGEVPGHRPCPECSAQPWRPHDTDCPTLVPVVVAQDGTPTTLDALASTGPRSCCTPDSLGALGNCSVCGWISPASGEDGEPRG